MRLAVVIAATRPSIVQTLSSIPNLGWIHVVVVIDGVRGLAAKVEEARPRASIIELDGRHDDWGAYARTVGMGVAMETLTVWPLKTENLYQSSPSSLLT